MAVMEILKYPHPVLRQVAKEVEVIDDEIRSLVSSMIETMYENEGVGLAAPQVGESLRIFVLDTAEPGAESDLQVFINPRVISKSEKVIWNEGCLSFPGIFEEVESFGLVEVEALNEYGEKFQLVAKDLKAVAILHETDHLNGVVFIDRLSPIRRKLFERKWAKRASKQS